MSEHDPLAKAGYPHEAEMSSTGSTGSFSYSVAERAVAVGRIVLFYPGQGDCELFERNGAECHPAMITRVWNDEMVNLIVFPDSGTPVPRTSVSFGEPAVSAHSTWRWPY